MYDISTLRLFIAAELPPEVRELLGRTHESLDAQGLPVRWVPTGNLHMTLQFLGDVNQVRVDAIHEALRETLAQVAPVSLTLETLGAFPSLRRPRVVWAGLGGDLAGLEILHRQVLSGTSQVGFLPEDRRFSPHITIGRVRERAKPRDLEALGTALSAQTLSRKPSWTLHEVQVVRSALRPDGAQYSPLRTIRLGG